MANAEGPGANCPTSETNIGFIHLAPIMHWVLHVMWQRSLATTCIEKSDEIPSNQTTYKTRAGVDTPENKRSSEGTRRFESCRPAFEDQAQLAGSTYGWHQEKPG
jgi:hypothetical protein